MTPRERRSPDDSSHNPPPIATFVLAIFLAAPAAAQVVSIDSSGNVTANGSYNSGTATGVSGVLSLKGSTSGVFGLTVGATPATFTWQIPNTATPTVGQIPVFGAPLSSTSTISYQTPLDASGSVLLQNPKFVRVSGATTASGNLDLYTCPTVSPARECMITAGTFYNTAASSITAYPEVKLSGSGTYYPLQASQAVPASSAATVGGVYFILGQGDTISVNATAAGLNVWMDDIEFDAATPLTQVKFTGLASGDNTLYSVPSGKTAIIATLGFGAPGFAAGVVRYSNATAGSVTAHLNVVPSGNSAGSSNQVSAAAAVTTISATSFNVNATLSSGDFISGNVNSSTSGTALSTSPS